MAPTKKRSSIRAKAAARSASSKPQTTFADQGRASTDSTNPQSTESSSSTLPLSQQTTKLQKRQTKSSSFLHRVAATGLTNSAGIKRKSSRRNRGAEAKSRGKLVTSLTSLADALPEFNISGNEISGLGLVGGTRAKKPTAGDKMVGILGENVSWEDVVNIRRTRSGNVAASGGLKITRMKSLGTKKGMGRRKVVLETKERRRFNQNMAVMLEDEKFGIGKKVDGKGEGEEVVKPASAAAGLQALRAFIHQNIATQKALG